MFTKNRFRLSKGFTLIELLVVLGVLGILLVAVLAVINPIAQIQKSNDARRKSDLESMQRALEIYYQDKGQYPPATANKINGINWGSVWTVNGQAYMAKIPADPLATHHYIYVSPNNQTYYLYANMERGKYDPNICNPLATACPNVPSGTNCGTSAACNYGVSSSNVTP